MRLGWTYVSVSFDVPAGAKWLKANVDMNGFYRVQYTESNWKALITQLKDDHTVSGVRVGGGGGGGGWWWW